MKATHLYHSGVVFEDEAVQLFFDVYRDFEEKVDLSKEVYFFVSHSHSDHYSATIKAFASDKTHYIVSDDIQSQSMSNGLVVVPDQRYALNNLIIQTYGSTDLGVSFLVKVDDFVIFHGGDLNWWHWESATPEEQQEEAKAYKAIVDGIEDVFIDIACIPVDPRLQSARFWAADYFLATKKVGDLMPIHYGDEIAIVEEYRKHRLQITGNAGKDGK